MKPLPSAPLTDEDYHILMWGSRADVTHERDQLLFSLDRIAETQDRRDAALIYGYEAAKAAMLAHYGRHEYLEARAWAVAKCKPRENVKLT